MRTKPPSTSSLDLPRGSRLLFLAALALAPLAGGRARADSSGVAVVVGRGPGVEAAATAGLALKLGVEAQRKGLPPIAPPRDLSGVLPAEDDPFLGECFLDDDCLLRLAAGLDQATVLLAVVERARDRPRARLAFVQPGSKLLLRRARELPSPLDQSLPQEALAMLEAGQARSRDAAGARGAPLPADAALRKTRRLWQVKCATCHGLDGRGRTVMGEKLRLRDLTDAAWQKGLDDRKLKESLVQGRHSEQEPGAGMRSYGERLAPEQIDALVAFVRGLAR